MFLFLCLMSLLAAQPVSAQQFGDPNADPNQLPNVPPGFSVQVVAREPLVRHPASLAFDARGRLFVGMGPQYRNPTPETPGDSVVLLTDTDGDGVLDAAKVFATGFNCIQSLAWHGRDLWIANSPDLTIVRDLDGDDVGDEYVRVFTDLGNLEHGLHGLNWAPDGRLYMSKGNSKGLNLADRYAPQPFRELFGLPAPSGAKDFPDPQTFKAADYRHAYQDPDDNWGYMGGVLRCDDGGRNLEIFARGLRNPWDIAFDSGFNWLGTDNDQNEGDRVFAPFFGAHFGWNHPWSSHWTGEGHLPTTPVSGPVFDGSGTGVVFYDSPQFPPEYRGVFFINDWLRKTTFLYRPHWNGALMMPEGGTWQPFISGHAALFRPTDLETGPDGALWCLGWGRGYGVEWENGKTNVSMASEGRIFRIAWTNAPASNWNTARRAKTSSQRSVAELIKDFDGPLPVWRIDAQDELVRRGAVVKSDLIAALSGGGLSEGQETWALWTLGRIAPEDATTDAWFAGAHGGINRTIQSLRILAHRSRASGGRELPAQIAGFLERPEPRIRFEAVQAIRQARQARFAEPLKALAARETDRITFYSAWQAMGALLSLDELRALLGDARGGVRCAALLALAASEMMDEATATRLVQDSDGPTAANAALWLSKHRGGSLVILVPPPGEFSQEARVNMERTLKPSDIRYTLDGTEPTLASPVYQRTFVLTATTTLRAALFVKNEKVGKSIEAVYRKADGITLEKTLLQPIASPTTVAQALPLVGKGDAARGGQLFLSTGGAGCFNCHRIGTRGNSFGPELVGIGQRSDPRHIIESILEPGAVITEGFSTQQIETKDAEYSGILLEESGLSLTLGLATGQRLTLAKKDITSRRSLASSAMPSFASLLTPQQCADLAAWLATQ